MFQTIAYRTQVEPCRRQEYRCDQQCGCGRVECDGGEHEHDKHKLADDRRERFEYARDGCQTDEVDVSGEYGRIGRLDELQPSVVIPDEKASRQPAVQIVYISALYAAEQDVGQRLYRDHGYYGRAYGDCKRRIGVESRERICPAEGRFGRQMAAAVENQHEHRHDHGQPYEVEQRPREYRGDDNRAASSHATRNYLYGFSQHRAKIRISREKKASSLAFFPRRSIFDEVKVRIREGNAKFI